MNVVERHKSATQQRSEPKKKVLFVSTYKTLCGIAAFTETLESHLQDRYDIDIGVLDQYILKSTNPKLITAGDKLIDDICSRAKDFDVVNLQWEPGLLGNTHRQILRRFRKLLRASPHMIVTVHTVVENPRFSTIQMIKAMRRGVTASIRFVNEMFIKYGQKTYLLLNEADRSDTFQVIVHTRRELRYFRQVIGLKNVYDHPLGLIRKTWGDGLKSRAQELRIKIENEFGSNKRFIGFFGFLSEYKGIITAIEALRFLPDDYVLLLFGGVHPSLHKDGQNVSPYLRKLLKIIHPSSDKAGKAKRSLFDRVQFLGAPDDFDFAASIAVCDINVFPYLEVGQSASGPVSQSIELGKRTIVSNNNMFSELEGYFPKRTYKVDIGNHLHLAQVIKRAMADPEPEKGGLQFTTWTLADFYASVIEKAASIQVRQET